MVDVVPMPLLPIAVSNDRLAMRIEQTFSDVYFEHRFSNNRCENDFSDILREYHFSMLF